MARMKKDGTEIEDGSSESELGWAGTTYDASEVKEADAPLASRSLTMIEPVYYALCRSNIDIAISRGTRKDATGVTRTARAPYYLRNNDRLFEYFDAQDLESGKFIIDRLDLITKEEEHNFKVNKSLLTIPRFKKLKSLPPSSIIDEWTNRKVVVNNRYNQRANTDGSMEKLDTFVEMKNLFYQCWGWYVWTGQDIFFDHFPKSLFKGSVGQQIAG